MLDTVNKSEYLTISDIARLFRIEKSIRTNVMRLLLNIEETKEIDLKLNFCDFYAVVSREKLEEALEITELPQTFMTVKEAVQTLKITERRVRLLISNGKLKNYAENLKREFLLDPKEVLAAEKNMRPRLRSEIFTNQAVQKYPLPRRTGRGNDLLNIPETEEERKQREFEIAKIRAKVESYKNLEPMRFFYRA
jgi:hypothetical protein